MATLDGKMERTRCLKNKKVKANIVAGLIMGIATSHRHILQLRGLPASQSSAPLDVS
jgi:hypothetical protein